MFAQEDVFRGQVTCELVDQCGLIKPLASLILDFALPTWTWNLDTKDGREMIVPNATRKTITIANPLIVDHSFRYLELEVAQPLNSGDRMMFVFDPIIDSSSPLPMYVTVKNHTHSDTISLRDIQNGGLSIDHVGKTTAKREGRYGYFGLNGVRPKSLGNANKGELTGIVLSRDDHEVRMRLIFRTSGAFQQEYQLSAVKAEEILYPSIAFFLLLGCRYDPFTIALANQLN